MVTMRRTGVTVRVKKAFCILLAALLLVAALPLQVLAEDTDASFVTEGTYSFTSNENDNKQLTDTFIYRDDCFMRSSHLGCCHLTELSAQVAIASTSRYGKEEDPDEVDPSNNSENIVNMLKDMGFEDVQTNKYYSLEKLENSAAVAVGKREIKAFGKTYTLLAIIPRSAGYKQEWVGNFTVEDGDHHEGFKAGRDEILRFVKQYMDKQGIDGDLKVWIAGHSRGAALSNMLGGFFAGGGIEYFGKDVSITPEDVYCYTYATPRTLVDGADKKTMLSVAGDRTAQGGGYENDTPGEAYTYPGNGSVSPGADEFKGIRNYAPAYDIIDLLPPSAWNFTWYGQELKPDAEGGITKEEMLAELAVISPFAYNEFLDGGDHTAFSRKTFDADNLEIVDDPDAPATDAGSFFAERIAGLVRNAKTNSDYASNGTQKTLQALAGVYGMALTFFHRENPVDVNSLIMPGVLAVLAYAAERIKDERGIGTDEEALAIALEEALSFITGAELSDTTVDDIIYNILKYLMDNAEVPKDEYGDPEDLIGKTKLAQTLIDALTSVLLDAVGQEHTEENEKTAHAMLAEIVGPSVYGQGDEDAEYYRQQLYMFLSMFVPEAESVFEEVDGKHGGKKTADAINDLLALLIDDYSGNIDEAADDEVNKAIDSVMNPLIEESVELYGQTYADDLQRHVNGMKDNVRQLRTLALDLLMYKDGEPFRVEDAMKTAVTFVGNVGIIPVAHYNELYVAWARAGRKKDIDNCDHYITHVDGKEATCTEEGLTEHWLFHDRGADKHYDDKYGTNEIPEAELVIDALGHDWGEWKQTKAPTETEEGEEERVCKRCGEKETRPIPKLDPSPDPGKDPSDPPTPEPDKKPVTPTDNTPSSNSKKAAKTGDGNRPVIWLSLLLGSAIILGTLKRKKEGRFR